jgi:hypothetical protein
MQPYANELATIAAATEDALFADDAVQPDARIAVTTTDGSGVLRTPATASEPYLALGFDAHYNATRNFTGSLTDALGELLDVGTSATAPVRPLDAAVNALAMNPSFLREYSFFGVVIISASDDASSGAVVDYATLLTNGRYDPSNVGVSGVYPQPSARLDAFFARFGPHAWTADIGAGDLSPAIASLQNGLKRILYLPCADEPSDVDPERDGAQYDCDFSADYADGTVESLPQCRADDTGRCFEFLEHAWCDRGSKLFHVRGFPARHSPPIHGECVVIPEI